MCQAPSRLHPLISRGLISHGTGTENFRIKHMGSVFANVSALVLYARKLVLTEIKHLCAYCFDQGWKFW